MARLMQKARESSTQADQKARLRFRKHQRLWGRKDFARVFRRRCRVSEDGLLAFVDRNDTGQPRLGISIGRRAGKAVERNREKRRLREAFRHCQHDLPAIDMIVVVKSTGRSVGEYEALVKRLAMSGERRLRKARYSRRSSPNP